MIEHGIRDDGKRLAALTVSRKAVSLLAVLLVFALGLSCGGGGSDSLPPPFTSEPQILMAPNPDTPLAGVLTVTTDVPTRVSLVVSDGEKSWTIDFDEFNTDHSLTVLGFRPGKTHTIEVSVIDGEGNETTLDKKIKVTTDPLPPGFPPIKVVSTPAKMEPGVTIFPVRARGANTAFGDVLVAVDETGEVVWYHRLTNFGFGDIRRMANGDLLFVQNFDKIVEMDMLGNVVQEWYASLGAEGDPGSIQVAVKAFHHEVFEMGNGDFLTLSVETRPIDGFPTSDTDPTAPTETATVAGAVIVEFAPDGTIVNQWSLLDILDPLRIGYSSLGGFWNGMFPEAVDGTRDWSHGNAVIYDSSDDSIIVSVRHQDAVIKFSRATGELIWILGPPENWDPVGFGGFLFTPTEVNEFFWQYHQHAPMVTPDGNILMFDNGNFRATPFDPKLPAVDNFSRAVEYSIDETTMEITQVWEYGQFADETIYAPFIGDADFLPETGNVLIAFGGIAKDADGNQTDKIGQAKISVRLIEVTHTTPAEKVFDLSIVDDSPEVANGWQTYRSERLPSLYP